MRRTIRTAGRTAGRTACLPVVLGLSLVACDSGDAQDRNSIRLTFDGDSCEEHPEVTTLDYQLYDLDGTSLQRVSVAPCGDAVFDDVPDGSKGPYLVRVWGFDQHANLQMKGECAGVELGAGACAVETYNETLYTDMLWDSDLGGEFAEGNCESSGVATFDYQLIRVTTREIVMEETGIECANALDFGLVRPENFILHVDAYGGGGAKLIDGANCVFGTSPYGTPSWCRLRIDG